jgi:hypothetical protein
VHTCVRDLLIVIDHNGNIVGEIEQFIAKDGCRGSRSKRIAGAEKSERFAADVGLNRLNRDDDV